MNTIVNLKENKIQNVSITTGLALQTQVIFKNTHNIPTLTGVNIFFVDLTKRYDKTAGKRNDGIYVPGSENTPFKLRFTRKKKTFYVMMRC